MIIPKLNLPTYAQVLIYVGGTAIVATVIVGSVFYFKNRQPASASTPTPAPVATVYPYDGTYLGQGEAASGLTNATATITQNKITGKATYSGTSNAAIGIDITGTVDAQGNVSGALSGSGSVAGYDVTGNGSYTGSISGTAMSISWKVTGGGGGETESHSGDLTLNKQ